MTRRAPPFIDEVGCCDVENMILVLYSLLVVLCSSDACHLCALYCCCESRTWWLLAYCSYILSGEEFGKVKLPYCSLRVRYSLLPMHHTSLLL
jgi:hypothetical protein